MHNVEKRSYLVLRRGGEEFTVEMSSEDDSSWRLRVVGCNDICHLFLPIRRVGLKMVNFDVPFESLQCRHDIFTNEGIICGVGWRESGKPKR